MDNKPEPDLAEAMRLARSPAVKQLMELLQKNDNGELQNALEKAKSGDFETARTAIDSLLSSPDAKALLKQLGGDHE